MALGDELISIPFAFFATAEAVASAGAMPVFCDIRPDTFNIDPALTEEKTTSRTKTIIPVHLCSQSDDMDPISEISAEHGLTVIEDAVQTIGARYHDRSVGSLGHVACMSLFPTKNLGAFGDAGMMIPWLIGSGC